MSVMPLANLRDRLLLLVLLTALPALGLMLYTNLEERRVAAAEVQANALRLARVTAQHHEQLVEGMRQLLRTLALVPGPRLGAAAPCGARFTDLLKQSPLYANLGVAGPDGGIVCSAVPLGEPASAEDRPWFERAVRTLEFALGEYEVDRARARSLLVGALPIPFPAGGTQAVIFAAMDLTWLNGFVGAAGLPNGWAVVITDARGSIVAHYPDPARWVGQPLPEASAIKAVLAEKGEGTAEVSAADGVERFYAFTPLPGGSPGTGAYVTVSVPRHVASLEADRILRRNLIGLGIAGILALVAAWVGSDLLVVHRMHALVTATQRFSAGDLTTRAEVRGGDELGVMAQAFNAMADRLTAMVEGEQRAKQALASRVDELVAQRTREVTLLTQMSDLLQTCFSPEEAYAVIGQMVGQFFPAHSGAVLVIASSRDEVRTVAAWGASRVRDRQAFGLDECWALRRGRAYSVDDCRSGLLCQHLGNPLPSAYVCVPLGAQGETLGVLHLASGTLDAEATPEPLGEGKRRLASTVAEQFALALANLKLRENLRSQSIRDPLTGLFNRRYMEETLERELRRADRERRSVGVIMLDIDQFKRFNDDLGHDAGDVVLQELGSLLKSNSRASDVACRYGGEEFVLILPATALADTCRRADELQETIRELRVSHRGQLLGPVRCSMGVSSFPTHGAKGEMLLRAADTALYRAKHAGRDQVMVAE